jgi:hypothetical protein
VVTRYGCGRGELFEGSMASRGARPCSPRLDGGPPRWLVLRCRGSGFRRNAANLMTGSGAQQTRELQRGESRRGGAKPRGRNGSWTGGAVGPKVSRGNSGRWEWTRSCHVGGGASGHEPQERKGLGPRSELRLWSAWPRGARPVCGRFEGDGRSWRADDGPYRPPA